ncbi:MAG: tripartite tricarboxylate transporter TctB family protein [Mycobacterium sp.]
MSETAPPPTTEGRISWGELAAALALTGVGVAMILDTSSIRVLATANAVGPRFFPYVVGGAATLVGLWLAIAVLRGDRAASEESEDIDLTQKTDWRTLAALAGAFVAYILIINPLGYLLSTMLFFGGTAFALGARRPRSLILTTLLVPLATFLIFTRLLGIYLPNGVLEAVI